MEEENWTSLMLAIQNGYTEVVKLLIEKGSDVNIIAFNDLSVLILGS